MSELEAPLLEPSESSDSVRRVTLGDGDESISVPDDATTAEAAAIVAVVGAQLSDRQRAAMAAAATKTPAETVDRWVLAARMRSRGKRHWQRDVERGDEWRVAARSL